MLEFFELTSNPNKPEVSIPSLEARWKHTDAQPQMLVFIHLWCSKMAMIYFIQLSPLAVVSWIPDHHHSGGRLVLAYFFRYPLGRSWFNFSLNVGMLTMRIYAIYERSRMVLSLYIGVGIVIVIVGCVSLNLRGNHTRSDIPLLIVGSIEYKKRQISRLLFKLGLQSRTVSTPPRRRLQVHTSQTHHSFLQRHPWVVLRAIPTRYIQLGPHRLGSSLGRNVGLRFTCVLHDTLQIYRHPSPKWIQHFGYFIAWWWALLAWNLIYFFWHSLRSDLLWVDFTFSFWISFWMNACTG